MHPHCRSRSSAGWLRNLTFSAAPTNASIHSGQESMVKTEQTLNTIFRQLRPSLRKPHAVNSHLRDLSQLALLRHLSFSHPSCNTRSGIPQPCFALRSLQTRRVSNSTPAPSSALAHSTHHPSNTQSLSEKPPVYQLTFTCKPCKHRSTHTVSKQGYHKGTVLITCPECSNRHVMSDHLKVGFQSLCVVNAKMKRLDSMNSDKR